MKRQIVKYIHASFATLSFGLMITGITFAWKSNEEYGGVHFYTAHSWLGLTLVSMMGLQWIFGVIGFLFQAVNPDIRKTLMVAHKFVGNTMLLMSIAVFVSGTAEKIAFGDANHSNLAAAGALFGAFTSILCSLVLYLYKLPADSTNPNAEKTPLLGAPALSVQTNH
jgi:cytochrome b561